MTCIYVLLLEKGKYYVGKTNSINIRIGAHFAGDGSVWTKMYKLLKIIEMIENIKPFDELRYTLCYMQKYGIKNVRGANFCEKRLSKEKIMLINEMILGEEDRCYICKSLEHFKGECQNTQKIYEKTEKDFDVNETNKKNSFMCSGCGISFQIETIYMC